MNGQTVGYLRVSSADQNTARQVAAIGEVAKVFEDHLSGKSRAPRHGLTEMMEWVRDGDTVRVASMDRLARSVVDLAEIVQQLTAVGVAVEFVAERLEFRPGADDPFATFQLHLVGAVAQLERELIRERQREGIALAKAHKKYRGRVRKLSDNQVDEARRRIAAGVPKAKVARDLGCSRSVLYDALAGRGPYAPEQPANDQPPAADVPPPVPPAATESTLDRPAKVSAATPTKKPAKKPARRRRWYSVEVEQTHQDDPTWPVVIVSSHASESAARRATNRHRRPGTDSAWQVRQAHQIHRYLEWDANLDKTVTRDGPPK